MATLKTGCGQVVTVVDGTERNVKPHPSGLTDEAWHIGRCADGRWVALSDAASQGPAYFDTEEAARQYWADADAV